MKPRSAMTSVYQGLVLRIRSGAYAVGTVLPGCRVLARELGVNKNTVDRAFKSMQEQGLIRNAVGVGMIVTRVPTNADMVDARDINAELTDLIRQARALGVSRGQLESTFGELLERLYEGKAASLALIECNIWDARSIARDIETRLGVRTTPILLDDFCRDPETVLLDHDMCITTFYHLTEVRAVTPDRQKPNIVAIEDKPSVKSLLALSGIPANARIAVAAAHKRTVDQLERTLVACGHRAESSAVLEEVSRDPNVFSQADVIVVSERCQAELKTTSPAQRVVVSFEIDAQSLAFIQKRLNDRPSLLKEDE